MARGKGKMKFKQGKKGQGGSRWNKGDSCVSNPEFRKFRDAVSSQHLHQVLVNPLLTVGNVEARHVEDDDSMDDDDVLSDDVKSAKCLTVSDGRAKSFAYTTKTFATNYTQCTNKTFDKFLKTGRMDSARDKDMLALINGAAEIIDGLGRRQTDTDYFASFVSVLDRCESDKYEAPIALLCKVIGKVPEPVLKKTFTEIFPKIGTILSESMDTSNHALTRMCCDILRKILGIQDARYFEEVVSLQSLLYLILKCCLHDNPKVRKMARQTIGQAMNQQKEQESRALQKLVLGWIHTQLTSYPPCGSKVAGNVLNLLQFVWTFVDTLQESAALKVYESVLRVMAASAGDNSILKAGFSLFSTIFKEGLYITVIATKVLSAIWDFGPDWRNCEDFIGWLRCIFDGLVRLSEQNEGCVYAYITIILEKVAPTWESKLNFGSVTSDVLNEYLQHVIKEDLELDHVENYFKIISRNLISIPPNPNCLAVLSALLNTMKPSHFCPSVREVLLQLIPLRLTTNGVGNVLGLFIKAFGVEHLWNSVSLEMKFTVILPLVRENLQGGNLYFWKENILPFAKDEERAELVWESLIGFCRDPEDGHNFPAQRLAELIVDCPKHRLAGLSALRQFGMWSDNGDILRKYSRNYLSRLFNLYISEKEGALEATKKKRDPDYVTTHHRGHADAIDTTIRQYLPFCEPDVVLDLVERATTKFLALPVTAHVEKSALLDLMTFMAGSVIDSTTGEKLFGICSNLIGDIHQTKCVYRILTALLDNELLPDELKDRICEFVRDNKGRIKSNAEPMRLNCINRIMLRNETWMSVFLPELILNLRSENARAKKISRNAVKVLASKMKERGENIGSLMGLIEKGLQSGNAFLTACTIHFMTSIYRDLRPSNFSEPLIKQCINHVLISEDSATKKESLAFISLNLSIYKSRMGIFESCIGEILGCGNVPRQETNGILAKVIKIFGLKGLSAILPTSLLDDPKMRNRIKNIHKKLKKRDIKPQDKQKGEFKIAAGSEDDESDDDVMDSLSMSASNLKLRTNRSAQLIKEGVVDFLDPGAMAASLINKPREVKEEDQIKFAPDGRLIIEDPSSKSEKGTGDDGMDDDELEVELPRSRKRKLGGGSIASSHRTKRSMKTTTSSKVSKASSYVTSRKSSKGKGSSSSDRPVVQAKRRKSSSSRTSTKSKGSTRFGYK